MSLPRDLAKPNINVAAKRGAWTQRIALPMQWGKQCLNSSIRTQLVAAHKRNFNGRGGKRSVGVYS